MIQLNIITLAFIGIIDYVEYKIPNAILLLWLAVKSLDIVFCTMPFKNIISSMFAFFMVAGSIIPLRQFAKCSAGDFKLYATLSAIIGLEDSLKVIFISNLISIFPLARGVKRVQMGFLTFVGYIAFLLLRGFRII